MSWGPVKNRGWTKSVGSGRIFEEAFGQQSVVLAVQEHFRPILAELHGVAAADLVHVAEKVSLKPPGCPALPPHLDTWRHGTYQASACKHYELIAYILDNCLVDRKYTSSD